LVVVGCELWLVPEAFDVQPAFFGVAFEDFWGGGLVSAYIAWQGTVGTKT